jgi:hypothetical protein
MTAAIGFPTANGHAATIAPDLVDLGETVTIDGLPLVQTQELDPQALAELDDLLALDARRRMLTEPEPERVRSIFEGKSKSFTRYRVEIVFRHKVMGGTPRNPDIIAGWVRSKAGVTSEEEVARMVGETLARLGERSAGNVPAEKVVEASEHVAALKSTNGFLTDDKGLYIPSRYVKALLKEACNIAFAGERWGKTKKGARNFLAERVFVEEDRLHLGRAKPDGLEMVIGHVDGPQGRRSTLAYHEFVLRPTVSFTVMSYRDEVTADQWQEILVLGQENGLGALRSQGHGRFDVVAFDRL